MTSEERAELRARIEAESRHSTHWQGCHDSHPDCMTLRLLDALERSEQGLAYLRKHGCYGALPIEGGTAVIGGTPTAEQVRKAVATIAARATPPEQGPSNGGRGERG